MTRAMVVMFVVAMAGGVATADTCKDKDACIQACVAGDPVSCELAYWSGKQTLTAKDEADRCRVSEYDHDAHQPSLCGAHLWAGIGVKADRAKAIEMWDHACDPGEGHVEGCIPWAIAVAKDQPTKVRDLMWDLCNDDAELPCRIGSQYLRHVEGEVDGVKYALDMPAMTRTFSAERLEHLSAHRGLHFFKWNNEIQAAITITLDAAGTLGCTHREGKTKGFVMPDGRVLVDQHTWLPAGWGDRACASLKKR